MPCFYKVREHFVEIMRHTIALNGALFNTQRMVAQYLPMPIDWGMGVCPSTHDLLRFVAKFLRMRLS